MSTLVLRHGHVIAEQAWPLRNTAVAMAPSFFGWTKPSAVGLSAIDRSRFTELTGVDNQDMNFCTSRSGLLHFLIGTFVLALVLRTWLVMGLVEPVRVAGSSMVPTLRGPHVELHCSTCGENYEVGAEFASQVDQTECPRCGEMDPLAEQVEVLDGDPLVIDRSMPWRRLPQRWEPVVFASPADAGNLAVKRVVGLPGEKIAIRGGDVWIDGQPARKYLAQQRALRQLVHGETARARRWQGDSAGDWHWSRDAWRLSQRGADSFWQWLSYQHPNQQPITDDSVYNAGVTRRLYAVRDFFLSAKLRCLGSGDLAFTIAEGHEEVGILLEIAQRNVEVRVAGETRAHTNLPESVVQAILRGEVLLELSNFDRQLLLAIEEREVVQFPLEQEVANAETARPIAIGGRGLGIILRELELYRDVYYVSPTEEVGRAEPMAPVTLGETEIYVLGDNSAVSIDSRHWGPLPLRYLVGHPLGVR